MRRTEAVVFGLALALLTGAASPVWAKVDRSAPPVFQARGTVQAAFTPRDDIEGLIVDTIAAADQQVLVQAYLLSNKAITQALLTAHRRGVDVRVLADRDQLASQGYSRIPELHQAGIPVRLEVRYKSAHNKVIIIDAASSRPVVITGSFNFTQTAQRGNAENMLVLRGHPELARAYAENWTRHASDALPYRSE